MEPLFAPALRRGQTIAIVAPAGPVDVEAVERACERLRQDGYQVRVPADLHRRRGYLAGDEQARVD